MEQQILLLAVLVLQVITIILLTGNRKKQGRGSGDVRRPVADFKGEKKEGEPHKPNSGGRKPGENRGGGNRPQQQSRPHQSQTPHAIDPMEKSLRDINLRLKNAEREQENARKKFQESGSGGGNRDSRPHQRSERGGNRNDRPPRDFNREQHRDNRPEKPPRSEQESSGFQAAATAEQPVTTPAAPAFTANDAGVSEELQHGRKFTAKRRPLPSDAAPETDLPEANAPETPAAPQFTESAPDVQAGEQTDGTDIQFGRR